MVAVKTNVARHGTVECDLEFINNVGRRPVQRVEPRPSAAVGSTPRASKYFATPTWPRKHAQVTPSASDAAS